MSFVKLDTGILTSTLWEEPDATKLVFITALVMAIPYEVAEPMEQLEVRDIKATGFVVPPGWYGFIAAAGIGIVRQARVEAEPGIAALEALGAPDPESRSSAFGGRRLVRVEGGYIVLNYFKFRDRDHTAAERMRKLRERKKSENRNGSNVRPNVTDSREQSTESREQKNRAENRAEPKSGSRRIANETNWRIFVSYLKERGLDTSDKKNRGWMRKLYDSDVNTQEMISSLNLSLEKNPRLPGNRDHVGWTHRILLEATKIANGEMAP